MASLADILADLGCLSTGAGYPCGENPINIVSLSLAASGLALIMVSCGIYICCNSLLSYDLFDMSYRSMTNTCILYCNNKSTRATK